MLSWERLMTWLGIKVLESGGRVEKDRNQGVWSAVFSSCSLWWFGCHVVFWSWLVQSQCNWLLGDFQVDTSCFHLVISFINIQVSFFSRTQHLPGLLPNHHITVLDWPTDSPDLNPAKTCEVLSRGRWETPEPKTQMSRTLLFKPPKLQKNLSSAISWLHPFCSTMSSSVYSVFFKLMFFF